jgi:hypothetical protein
MVRLPCLPRSRTYSLSRTSIVALSTNGSVGYRCAGAYRTGRCNPPGFPLIYVAAGAFAAVAPAFALWPFIDSMNPSSDVKALSTTEVDLGPVQLGQRNGVATKACLHRDHFLVGRKIIGWHCKISRCRTVRTASRRARNSAKILQAHRLLLGFVDKVWRSSPY